MGHRAQGEGHGQPVPGIVARAPHLGGIPGLPQIAGPPFRIGLEAAASQHHSPGADLANAAGTLGGDPGDPAGSVPEQPDGSGLVAHLHPQLLHDSEPHFGKAHALVLGPHHGAGGPAYLAVHLDGAQGDGGLHLDPLLHQPAHGIVGAPDHDFGQIRVGAALGDPQQIRPEHLLGIGLHALVEAGHLLFRVGEDGQQIFRLVEGEPVEAPTVMGVSAAQFLGRLFQHQHPLRSRLPGRSRRSQGRIAGPYYDYVVPAVPFCHVPGFPKFKLIRLEISLPLVLRFPTAHIWKVISPNNYTMLGQTTTIKIGN